MTLSFGPDKARAIVALPMGARFQTRRGIKLHGDHARWLLKAGGPLTGTHWAFYCDGDPGEAEYLRPRYRPGRTYPLGFPHMATGKGTRNEQVYVPCLRAIIRKDDPNVLSVEDVAGVEWNTPMRAGYTLPGYAYTHWVKVLCAEPQHAGDITEEQAVAELVERWTHRLGDVLEEHSHWRDYGLDGYQYTLDTARESFFTLLAKVNGGTPVPPETWVWAYELQLVEPPAKGEKGASHAD